jgi:hypothetical protein
MKETGKKIMMSLTLISFLLLSVNTTVFAYGGGGGGDAGGGGEIATSTTITPLTDEQIKKIFSLLDAKSRETLSKAFSGTGKTARELMAIRQAILEGEMASANAAASVMNALTVTVECLDKAGQWSQFALSFVPGVGWVTTGTLDAARAGANAYRDGKDIKEILTDATIAGVTSVTINKLSPLDADKTFNSARAAFNIARTGSKKAQTTAIKLAAKNVIKFGGKKGSEYYAGAALSSALNSATKQAPNRVAPPAYINSSLGYDTTIYGTPVYK